MRTEGPVQTHEVPLTASRNSNMFLGYVSHEHYIISDAVSMKSLHNSTSQRRILARNGRAFAVRPWDLGK